MPVDPSKVLAMLKRIHLFRGLDDQRLQIAVDMLETIEAPDGTFIFQQDEDSEHFYFLLSGRVSLSRFYPGTHQSHPIGALEEDDCFGHEVLDSNWPRQVSATTVGDCTVLRINVPNFVSLIHQIPVLSKRLELVLESYRLMLKTNFNWLDPDEMIYFVARRDIFTMLRMIIAPVLFGFVTVPLFLFLYLTSPLSMTMLVLLVLVSLITAVWLAWSYVDWGNDYYVVTNKRTINQEKVVLLYDSRHESPNESIQSTSINTTQLGRILGYGNVAIRTFIGTILFREIAMPEQVMGIVQEQQMRAQSSQQRSQLKSMETSIGRKIGLIPNPAPAPKPAPLPKITPWQQFLSDMFHLRYEVNGTILYRTHWFILLKKIALPSLTLIGLVALFLLRASNLFTAISIQATCGLTGMLALIVFGWWVYQYLDWHNDIYLITPDQIVDVDKKPLGRESRRAGPIKNILSIEYKRLGIIGLLLNFGTVYIGVGDQQLTFDEVYNPSEVQRELFHRLAAKSHAEKQAQAEGERQRMGEWIAAYHRVTHANQPPRTPPPPARGGF